MNHRFISLVPDAPEGFAFGVPTKRDLLNGQICIFADSLESCSALLDEFRLRMAGLIVTRGDVLSYDAIGPHLWHLRVAPDSKYELLEIAALFLGQIATGQRLHERNDQLEIELARSKRDYTLIRNDFSNHENYLAKKVQDLRNEIRKRKKVETQLKIFQTFAETSKQGIGWIDEEGRVVYLNPTLLELITGRTDVSLTGQNALDYYAGQDQERLKNEVIPAILRDGKWSGELTLVRKDTGEPIPTQNNAFLIHDEHSDTPYLANIIDDLRVQKKTELELLRIKKLDSLGILAGGIAHDFNNLLAAILGNLELAGMDIEPSTKTCLQLEQARKACIRAKGLTQQLLTFSKGGEPIRHEASISAIIMESASFILHGSAVACLYDFPDNLRKVEVDAGQISQVIQNLVINACNAMPEGGEIHIACENLADAAAPDGIASPVQITIADTGSGIAPEHIDKIFDPYFTTKPGGTGLGLSICHSVIAKHGGTISVQSRPNIGTTFTLCLPGTQDSCETPVAALRPAPVRKAGTLRFLVMDDEELILTVFQHVLVRLGHEVHVARSGREAIETYRTQQAVSRPIDVTIMDLTIPGGMGGKDAVKEIHRLDPDAVVIVSSGYSGDPVMANYREYGFSAAIAKPFEIDDLRALLDAITR